jgi:hypothetical protein
MSALPLRLDAPKAGELVEVAIERSDRNGFGLGERGERVSFN